MKGKAAVVLFSGLLFACVQAPPPTTTAAPPPAPPPAPAVAPAPVAEAPPANRRVSIRAVRCARLLELPEDDRAAASLFYLGYQASSLRARTSMSVRSRTRKAGRSPTARQTRTARLSTPSGRRMCERLDEGAPFLRDSIFFRVGG